MKKNLLAITLVATSFISPLAGARTVDSVKNGQGSPVIDARGNCVRSKWVLDYDPCGYELPPQPVAPVVAVTEPVKEIEKQRTITSIDLIRQSIYFNFDKYNIDSEDKQRMQEVIDEVKKADGVKSVKTVGYADRFASDGYNLELSKNRAIAVLNYFRGQNYFNDVNVGFGYFGERKPITNCPTNVSISKQIACLQPDRRVDIEVETLRNRLETYKEPVAATTENAAPLVPVVPVATLPAKGPAATQAPAPVVSAPVVIPAPAAVSPVSQVNPAAPAATSVTAPATIAPAATPASTIKSGIPVSLQNKSMPAGQVNATSGQAMAPIAAALASEASGEVVRAPRVPMEATYAANVAPATPASVTQLAMTTPIVTIPAVTIPNAVHTNAIQVDAAAQLQQSAQAPKKPEIIVTPVEKISAAAQTLSSPEMIPTGTSEVIPIVATNSDARSIPGAEKPGTEKVEVYSRPINPNEVVLDKNGIVHELAKATGNELERNIAVSTPDIKTENLPKSLQPGYGASTVQ